MTARPWALANDAAWGGWGCSLLDPDGRLRAVAWWCRPSGATGSRRRREHLRLALDQVRGMVADFDVQPRALLVVVEEAPKAMGRSSMRTGYALGGMVESVAVDLASLSAYPVVDVTTGFSPGGMDWRPWVGIGKPPRTAKGRDGRREWLKASAVMLARARREDRELLDQLPAKGLEDAAEAVLQGRAAQLMWAAGLIAAEGRAVQPRMVVARRAPPERQ